jgi:two-component system sensor histidine kinase/response regulator, hybrid (one component system)
MNKTVKIQTLLLALLFLYISSYIQAREHFAFSHINGNVGLSSGNVKTILQDSRGLMWFGTKNGLNRYDGYSVKHLDCYDRQRHIGNNNIGALYEDDQQQLWVGTDRGIYIFHPTTATFHFVVTKTAGGVSPDNWVQEICGDKRGNVWALLPDMGVFRWHAGTMSYYRITQKRGIKKQNPTSICVQPGGDVLVGTASAGLFRYDARAECFNYVYEGDAFHFKNKNIISICNENADNVLLGTESGELYRYHLSTGKITEVFFSGSRHIFLRDLLCLNNELWIGTQQGLYIIDLKTGIERCLKEDLKNRFSLSDNVIYYIYHAPDGSTWVGTMFGGVNYITGNPFYFNSFLSSNFASSKEHIRIRGLARLANGKIMIGSEAHGIYVLDPRTGMIEKSSGQYNTAGITFMRRSGKALQIGLLRNGLRIDEKGETHILSKIDPEITDNSIYAALTDRENNLWVGLGSGLYVRKHSENTFQRVEKVGYDWIFDILEASDGTLWMATMGNGIWHYMPRTDTFRRYVYDTRSPNGLRSNSISSIMEDKQRNIWFSTDRGGISRYNPKTDNFTSWGIQEGLPDDVTYDILQDAKGFLWFGTNKGLVKFHPQRHSIKVFSAKDGLPGNEFNYRSAECDEQGNFYFGGINGLVMFNPLTDVSHTQKPRLYFTRLLIGGKEVSGNTDIFFKDKIVLPHDSANIVLEMASPDFVSMGNKYYKYKLEPIDKDWMEVNMQSGVPSVAYANLPIGNYTLHISVENSGQTTERQLYITILAPWYRTFWAYLCYGLLLITGILLWFRWYRKYKDRGIEARQKLLTSEKEKEVYESKVRFFTEIAHEIRTPLTLIEAPLEAMGEMESVDQKMTHYIAVTRSNTKRLLQLTEQLLDFRKVETANLQLQYEQTDINTLLNDIISRFEPTITLRRKTLIYNITDRQITAEIDRDAVIKIVSNLLNNALKYAHSTIIVGMNLTGNSFEISIASDGEKITEADARHIFEPFFQTGDTNDKQGGVGLGLSVARSLAEMHEGTLTLSTENREDNMFILSLPIKSKSTEKRRLITSETVTYISDDDSPLETPTQQGYTLLLVEDHDDMRQFIAEQMAHHFIVETANEGREALSILSESHIDIIVTDIMMPIMDGFELCRTVKNDINISHIPIVFLTAKNDIQSKIEGLKSGAESYIEKPFSIKYLRQQLLSILDNRRRERTAFSQNPFFGIDSMKMNKADEEFMNKVICKIEEHLSDETFNVEAMADLFCMSRSSLLRKIKTLFNLSPIELIRTIRLKKAAQLIRDGNHSIADVGFMVGITSAAYFSKQFGKQFGITPKDFEKQCKGNIKN